VKYLALAIAALNLYLGMRCFLNLVHVLNDSKYSTASTTVFAILFLTLGAASVYYTIWSANPKLALWLGIAPWLLSFVVLFFSMLMSDHH
jgi:hypothetical protein